MAPARYILIGGFLGAGKTTAVLKLAERLAARGLRVGLITNDQSIDLVDTARARAAGFPVEEITGGCFCCKFDSLLEAAKQLTRASAPDVLIAEPVGSCTDIKATVGYPLKQLYGDAYRVAPFSVLVDPRRCAGVLGLAGQKRFSDKVIYVYKKQLEEAEIIAVNKVDLLAAGERAALRAALGREFPRAELIEVSCLGGEGLDGWFGRILERDLGGGVIDVDYDEYAEGEALLGWFNARGRLSSDAEFDGDALLLDLAGRIRDRLAARGIEIAHLKMTLGPENGPDLAAVSLTRSDEEPRPTHLLRSELSDGDLMVNLRAEAEPELLRAAAFDVLAALGAARALRFEPRHTAAFRPGRPRPTHRLSAPPPG